MSNEELSKPRYKVIADFPHNNYKVGDIVDGTPWENNWGVDFKDYPAIFKKLEWWQARKKDDLPQYVRIGDVVWKVDGWGEGILDMLPYAKSDNEEGRRDGFLSVEWNFRRDKSRPATREEYETFIQKQQPHESE